MTTHRNSFRRKQWGLGLRVPPPPMASPCKAAFRLRWRCFVLRTNICREKTEFQLGVEGEGGLPVFTKQITLATVTANVDSPPLLILWYKFQWKCNLKLLRKNSTHCCLEADLNMHELEMVWKSLWFLSDRDISVVRNRRWLWGWLQSRSLMGDHDQGLYDDLSPYCTK